MGFQSHIRMMKLVSLKKFPGWIFEALKSQFLDQKSQISEDLCFSMLWSAEITQLCAPLGSERWYQLTRPNVRWKAQVIGFILNTNMLYAWMTQHIYKLKFVNVNLMYFWMDFALKSCFGCFCRWNDVQILEKIFWTTTSSKWWFSWTVWVKYMRGSAFESLGCVLWKFLKKIYPSSFPFGFCYNWGRVEAEDLSKSRNFLNPSSIVAETKGKWGRIKFFQKISKNTS